MPTEDEVLAKIEEAIDADDTQLEAYWMGILRDRYPDAYQMVVEQLAADEQLQAPAAPAPAVPAAAGELKDPEGNPYDPLNPNIITRPNGQEGFWDMNTSGAWHFTETKPAPKATAPASTRPPDEDAGLGREWKWDGNRWVSTPVEVEKPVRTVGMDPDDQFGVTYTDASGKLYQWNVRKIGNTNYAYRDYLPETAQPQQPKAPSASQSWATGNQTQVTDKPTGTVTTKIEMTDGTKKWWVDQTSTVNKAQTQWPSGYTPGTTIQDPGTRLWGQYQDDGTGTGNVKFVPTAGQAQPRAPDWAKTEAEDWMAEQTAIWQKQQNWESDKAERAADRDAALQARTGDRAWDYAGKLQAAEQARQNREADMAWNRQQLQATREGQAAEERRFQAQLAAEKEARLAQMAANPKSWIEWAVAKGPGTQVSVQPWMVPLGGGQLGQNINLWRTPEPEPAGERVQIGTSASGEPITQWREIDQSPGAISGSLTGGEMTDVNRQRIAAAGGQGIIPQVTRPGQSLSSPEIEAVKASRWGTSVSEPTLDMSQLPSLLRPSPQMWAAMGPTAQQQYYGLQQAKTGIRPEEEQFRQWSYNPGMTGATRYRR